MSLIISPLGHITALSCTHDDTIFYHITSKVIAGCIILIKHARSIINEVASRLD